MNEQQFTVDGTTYEVHRKTIRDGLTIDKLNTQFYQAGITDSHDFAAAVMFSQFIVGTRVVSGEPQAFMVSPSAAISDLLAARELWLDQPSELSAKWQEAAANTELAGNKPELSPLADPNA